MNEQTSAIVPAPAKEVKVAEYFKHESVQENFAAVLGGQRARGFITSVLIAVSESEELQKCDVRTIYASAMRAAVLGLSVDPTTRQAYLVPFKGKCTFIAGYKGLYDMAVRTGKYRWINVSPIYEGQQWIEDAASGLLSLTGAPTKKDDNHIVGWYAGFQLFDGYTKQIQMSVPEIHAYAKRYSKSYGFDTSAWKTATREMEKKTILRRLLTKWGYLDPSDRELLESADEAIDAPILPVDAERAAIAPERKRSVKEINEELGFGEEPVDVNRLPAPRHENDVDTFLASASRLMPESEASGILDRFKGNAKQAWEHVRSLGQPGRPAKA